MSAGENKCTAIIVAGGSGSRMGTEVPKQFLRLGNQPVLMHTLQTFARVCSELILVLPSAQRETWDSLVRDYNFEVPHRIADGGATRFQSVRNGLALVRENSIVAIHDGVRPLVSQELIRRCVEDAERFGTSIPYVPVSDSIRSRQGDTYHVEDRSRFILIQTPQCFRSSQILEAYSIEERPTFTDDASVVEQAGMPLHFTPGERWNIKITYPEDLTLVESLMSQRS